MLRPAVRVTVNLYMLALACFRVCALHVGPVFSYLVALRIHLRLILPDIPVVLVPHLPHFFVDLRAMLW